MFSAGQRPTGAPYVSPSRSTSRRAVSRPRSRRPVTPGPAVSPAGTNVDAHGPGVAAVGIPGKSPGSSVPISSAPSAPHPPASRAIAATAAVAARRRKARMKAPRTWWHMPPRRRERSATAPIARLASTTAPQTALIPVFVDGRATRSPRQDGRLFVERHDR